MTLISIKKFLMQFLDLVIGTSVHAPPLFNDGLTMYFVELSSEHTFPIGQ